MSNALLEVPPKPKHSLWDYTQDIQALHDLMMEVGGDVTEAEVFEAMTLWEAENADNIAAKADNIVRYVKGQQAHRDALKAEATRLREQADIADRAAERVKAMCHRVMDLAGLSKIQGDIYSVSIVKNGGVAPLTVYIEDAKELPEQFQKWSVAPDNAAIRAALEAGDAEAATIAEIGERGVSVRMK